MKPCEIHWEVTNGCNLRCKHCLPSSGPPRVNELTTLEAKEALATLNAAGVSGICFTGGEPFGRADFLDLLETASAFGMRISVITNGTLLKRDVLELICRMGIVMGLSLDGADATVNDAIRGNGCFGRVESALSQCLEIGIATNVYVTVNAANIDSLADIAGLARRYGCKSVHFNEVTIAGRAERFSDRLRLSEEQKKRLPETVSSAVAAAFGETLSVADEECWVDGSVIYMTADGNLYACSEVFQRRPEMSVGNIGSFDLGSWLGNRTGSWSELGGKCCYKIRASEHAVIVENVNRGCLLTDGGIKLETLDQLYGALGDLYHDIELDCKECRDPDCMGYIWLLKKESERLYEKGVPIVQVNDGPNFIHSFPTTAEGKPDLTVRYPSCSQLHPDCRRCSIHADRPMVCRLYPMGLEMQSDGTVVWALHLDCQHVRRLEDCGLLPGLESRVMDILNRIGPELLEDIVETYRAVDAISSFPDGENNYKPLQRVSYVKMQGGS